MMIVLEGMIGCCASEALVLVMIVVMIVVKSMIRWSMSGGRHTPLGNEALSERTRQGILGDPSPRILHIALELRNRHSRIRLGHWNERA